MKYNWIPTLWNFDVSPDSELITFKGEKHPYESNGKTAIGSKIGIILSDQQFNEGIIEMDVEFQKIDERSGCEIIFNYDSTTENYLSAGIATAGGMFGIKYFINGNLNYYKQVGEHKNLLPNRPYHLELKLKGSKLMLKADGVEVITYNIPLNIMQSQVGIFCMSQTDIFIRNFKVSSQKPKVFMVMQFSDKYDELYQEVVREVCESKEYDLDTFKADEIYGPGIIIGDIIKSISEAKIVIAEISPHNSNVFYEVGYAHALNKPTILIAEKGTELPFDVSPFRVLFYENTIAGKKKVQTGLKKHLNSILSE